MTIKPQPRLLFNAKAANPGRHVYKVRIHHGQLLLHAGSANGVCSGAQFTVYADGVNLQTPIGVLETDEIQSFQTLMRTVGTFDPESRFADEAYAVQSRAGIREVLRVYMDVTQTFQPALEAYLSTLKEGTTELKRIAIVPDKVTADLELRKIADDFRLVLLDDRVRAHGLTECIFKLLAEVARIQRAFEDASLFYYQLNRSGLEPIFDVVFELVKLEATGVFGIMAISY